MAEAEREFDVRHEAQQSVMVQAGARGLATGSRILSIWLWNISGAVDVVVIAENYIKNTSVYSGRNRAVDDGRM